MSRELTPEEEAAFNKGYILGMRRAETWAGRQSRVLSGRYARAYEELRLAVRSMISQEERHRNVT